MLVVDDIPELVEELIEMLDLVDIRGRGAATIDEALSVLNGEPTIRVVICDVRLRGEDGTEIIGRVNACPQLAERSLRYVFITGDPLQADMLGSGFEGLVLAKPVQPRVLIAHLQEILSSSGRGW